MALAEPTDPEERLDLALEDDIDLEQYEVELAYERAKPDSGRVPPNLKQAESPGIDCDHCRWFSDGNCTLYDYPVDATMWCEAFEPIEESAV